MTRLGSGAGGANPRTPSLVRKLEESARRWIFGHPAALRLYSVIRPKLRSLITDARTEIVIEGFPRSGNTFAVAAFKYAQGRDVRIARHCHAPAQVLEGVRRGLPVIVLKREPVAAVSSLLMRDDRLAISTALERYRWFYQSIMPVRDRVVVVDFDELVSNYAAGIRRVNEMFGGAYHPYANSPDDDQRVFEIVERMEEQDSGGVLRETHVARPSDERKLQTVGVKLEMRSPRWESLIDECRDLYRSI